MYKDVFRVYGDQERMEQCSGLFYRLGTMIPTRPRSRERTGLVVGKGSPDRRMVFGEGHNHPTEIQQGLAVVPHSGQPSRAG